MKRDSGSLIFAGIFFLISATVVLYFYFSKVNITSKNDIQLISGSFQSYDWVDKGGRNGSSLTFHLTNYNARFKIKADFFSLFKKDSFKRITKGNSLTIGILHNKTKLLNSPQQTLFVYSISSDDFTYLALDDTIKKHNTNLFLFATVFFAVLGALLIYFGHRAKVKTPIF